MVKDFFSELLFPSFCLGCQKEGTYLCHDCKETLEISEYGYCLCNKDPIRLLIGTKKGTCNRCRDKILAGLYFALPYKEKALTRALIYQFKYQPYLMKDLGKTLAFLIIEHLILTKNNTEAIWAGAVLVPVPLDRKKYKARGYNQSKELAQELGKIIQIPVLSHVLIKISPTESQMKLSAPERQENIRDAFSIKKPAEIAGKKVFLVDDVYTTGATMEECARVSQDAGAKSVWGIAIAREG